MALACSLAIVSPTFLQHVLSRGESALPEQNSAPPDAWQFVWRAVGPGLAPGRRAAPSPREGVLSPFATRRPVARRSISPKRSTLGGARSYYRPTPSNDCSNP